MTIYKPKPGDKKVEQKKEASAVKIPEDAKPLAAGKRAEPVKVLVFPPVQRRRNRLFFCCLMFLLVALVTALAIGGYFLAQCIAHSNRTSRDAEVHYYEYQMVSGSSRRKRVEGTFTERIMIDANKPWCETIEVPPVLDARGASVVHDFQTNWTAIADRENGLCFIMPLNRTAVKPPKSFLDLFVKYQTGYYMPDAEVIRGNYKVRLPAINDLSQFGVYISYDCSWYESYMLIPDKTQPKEISKRSACEMAGASYCLGDGGTDSMLVVKLTGCD